MLQREVNGLKPLPSMIVSVLLLGSTWRNDTTPGGTRQPVSPVGKYPTGVGGVAADTPTLVFIGVVFATLS
jgi:hypothetical protein